MDVLLQHKAIYTKYGSMDELLQGHIYIYYCKSTSAFMCAHSCSTKKQGCLLLLMSHPVLAKVPRCTAGCGAQTRLLVSDLMLYNSLGLQTASWETVSADVGTQSSTIVLQPVHMTFLEEAIYGGPQSRNDCPGTHCLVPALQVPVGGG